MAQGGDIVQESKEFGRMVKRRLVRKVLYICPDCRAVKWMPEWADAPWCPRCWPEEIDGSNYTYKKDAAGVQAGALEPQDEDVLPLPENEPGELWGGHL